MKSEDGRKESAGHKSYGKETSKLEKHRRVLEKDLDDMYPWRQKKPGATGMKFIQPTAISVNKTTKMTTPIQDSPKSSLMSIGMSDLEYSMEPRNFSRASTRPLLVPAPFAKASDSAVAVDVQTSKGYPKKIQSVNEGDSVAASSAKKEGEVKKIESFYDELVSCLLAMIVH